MKKYIYILVVSTIIFCSCGRSDVNNFYGSTEQPPQVTDVTVVPQDGGAVLKYTVPKDPDVKYIHCEYKTKEENDIRVSNASVYTDSLIIDGYSQAGTYQVKLFTVSTGGTYSDPMTVDVTVLDPPIVTIPQTVTCTAVSGGMKMEFKNPTKASIKMTILKKTESDEWKEVQSLYSAAENGTLYLRGQEAVETTFGIKIRDRWGNESGITEHTLTPIFEGVCGYIKDSKKYDFVEYPLPGDNKGQHGGAYTAMDKIWDGDKSSHYHTAPNTFDPIRNSTWFTFDMKKKYKISRYVLWERTETALLYANACPRYWKLWGANGTEPDFASGSFSAWTLIGDYEMKKPSGEPLGIVTEEDREQYQRGFDFTVRDDVKAYRYYRFETLETWAYLQYVFICQLDFFYSAIEE